MFQFIMTLQQSHSSLRILGAVAAGMILISCLAIAFLQKPSRRMIFPSITLAIGVLLLAWTMIFFESA